MEYTLSGAVFLYKEYPRIVCAEVGYCRWCEKDCMSNKRTSPLCVKGGVKGGLLLQEVMSFHAETWWVMIAPCGTSYDLRYAQSRGGATHLFIKQSLSQLRSHVSPPLRKTWRLGHRSGRGYALAHLTLPKQRVSAVWRIAMFDPLHKGACNADTVI